MFSARIVVPIGKQIIRSYSQTASRRRHSYVPLYAIAFAAGLGLSYKYSAQEIVDQFITTPLPTTPQETEKYQQELEKKLKQVPVVAELSKDPKYVATRAWNQLDTVKDGIHQRLNTPGSIAIAPITFHNQDPWWHYLAGDRRNIEETLHATKWADRPSKGPHEKPYSKL
ncbi:hypothetical protein KL905_004349 [Ogataea polymorpha]|nr:hypothetical protein KL908_004062 [Ogataea polymorpha]KAG7898030.1 hypothetical protein KL935_004583 [Ogataea polymorpha]KAG7900543.1 hypothetical protein KL907_004661 [Ogataea polymorpha]KAG7906196.1 hypothetical protein KL906_004649 [Ogataea polymorpha]KAG7914131.1 hypothetical protein KL927_004782 [Ogataea polymorpha]